MDKPFLRLMRALLSRKIDKMPMSLDLGAAVLVVSCAGNKHLVTKRGLPGIHPNVPNITLGGNGDAPAAQPGTHAKDRSPDDCQHQCGRFRGRRRWVDFI